jgi:hypothetical protein
VAFTEFLKGDSGLRGTHAFGDTPFRDRLSARIARASQECFGIDGRFFRRGKTPAKDVAGFAVCPWVQVGSLQQAFEDLNTQLRSKLGE